MSLCSSLVGVAFNDLVSILAARLLSGRFSFASTASDYTSRGWLGWVYSSYVATTASGVAAAAAAGMTDVVDYLFPQALG